MGLSYTHGASDVPLLGMCIGENLRATVERNADRLALVVPHQGVRQTYAELWDDVTQAARGLMAMGLRKGDRVGMWSPNRYEWVVAQYATARIGAILVNINPAYRAHELEYALEQSGVRLLLMAAGFRTTSYTRILEEIVGSDFVEGALSNDAGVDRPAHNGGARCPALESILVLDAHWKDLYRRAADVPLSALEERESSLSFDDPINIQYTSGTTGAPKGATLSHHNILNNGYFCANKLKYTPEDRVCIPVPFYHCFGMVIGNLACTSVGATMVVPGESFDAESTMRCIEDERCTALYGVPTMFIAQLEHRRFKEFDFSSLRTGVMAGSPCPVEVMHRVQSEMHMPEVTICYGMTETSPVSTQSSPDDPLDKRVSTVGQIHPHVEIKIIDPLTGANVPIGERGELCTRGYSVMLGYWNNDEATDQAIDSARWMHTQDLAIMDAEGFVQIVGRIKDMIIRGGENIYPREIEEFLYRHPDLADAQVVGIPSEKYGEEVMAWVKPKEGHTVDPASLAAFCKGKIATFKIPQYWKITDAFPMTVTGKIQKYKMREISISELRRG